MTGVRTLHGWSLVPVLDDDGTIEGWDVMEPGSDSSCDPWEEMVESLSEARAIVRAEVRERRLTAAMGRLA